MPIIGVLASFNMDLVMNAARRPRGGETLAGEFAMFLGGKGFNQAIAARRLGAEVVVAGRVGDDEFGRRFLAALSEEGIDGSAVTMDSERPTGVASIVVDATGENAIVCAQGANLAVTRADIGSLARCDATLSTLETPAECGIALASATRAAGGTAVVNPAPATAAPDGLLAAASVVVVNEFEAEALSGVPVRTVDDAFAAANRLRARGAGATIVTLGAGGAVAVADGTREYVPALSVDAIDTVGAGDAFCAALAVRLAEGAPFVAAVQFASAAGAAATTRRGAAPSMPARPDVEALIADGGRS